MANPQTQDRDQELKSLIDDMLKAGKSDDDVMDLIRHYDDNRDSLVDQTLAELRGLTMGLPAAVFGAVKGTLIDLPVGVVSDIYSKLHGGDMTYAKSVVDGLANAPKEFENATHEERGEMLSNLLVGGLSAKAAPSSVKPIARTTGRVLEAAGTKGGWPIRMMGAHQLGSGNPLGAVMMAVPEGLEAVGSALQRFGNNQTAKVVPGNVRLGIRPKTDVGLFTRGERSSIPGLSGQQLSRAVEDIRTGLNRNIEAPDAATTAIAQGTAGPSLVQDLDKNIAATKREMATIRKANAAEDVNARKLASIQQAAAGLKPGQPSISRSVSAQTPEGERMSMSVKLKPEDAGSTDPVSTLMRELKKNAPNANAEDLRGMAEKILARRGSDVIGAVRPPIAPTGKAAADLAAGRVPVAGAPITESRAIEMAGKLGGTKVEEGISPVAQPLPTGAEDVIARQRAVSEPVATAMREAGHFGGQRTTMPAIQVEEASLPPSWRKLTGTGTPEPTQRVREGVGKGPMNLEGAEETKYTTPAKSQKDFLDGVNDMMRDTPSKSKSNSGWTNLSENDIQTAVNAWQSGVRTPGEIREVLAQKRLNRQADHIGAYYADRQPILKD